MSGRGKGGMGVEGGSEERVERAGGGFKGGVKEGLTKVTVFLTPLCNPTYSAQTVIQLSANVTSQILG